MSIPQHLLVQPAIIIRCESDLEVCEPGNILEILQVPEVAITATTQHEHQQQQQHPLQPPSEQLPKQELNNGISFTSKQQWEKIVESLSMNKSTRSARDLTSLMAVIEKIPFFSQYFIDTDILFRWCSSMFLQSLPASSTVFEKDLHEQSWFDMLDSNKQGQKGEEFYIIIKGEVEVFDEYTLNTLQINQGINKKPEPLKQPQSPKKRRIRINAKKIQSPQSDQSQKNATGVAQQANELDDLANSNKDEEENPTQMQDNSKKQLVLIKRLGEGDSFGEMALIYKKLRSATVKCATDCIFAVLQKDFFQEVLKSSEAKRIALAVSNLTQVPLFAELSVEGVRDIFLVSKTVHYKKGEVVFSQNDNPNSVYIIQSGDFSVNHCFQFQPNEPQSPDSFQELRRQTAASINKIFTLMKMCTNEVFGEEEVILNIPRRYEVTCSSFSGTLLAIKHIDFIGRIYNRSNEIRDFIVKRMRAKSSHLISKQSDLQEQYSKYKNYLIEDRSQYKDSILPLAHQSQQQQNQNHFLSSSYQQQSPGLRTSTAMNASQSTAASQYSATSSQLTTKASPRPKAAKQHAITPNNEYLESTELASSHQQNSNMNTSIGSPQKQRRPQSQSSQSMCMSPLLNNNLKQLTSQNHYILTEPREHNNHTKLNRQFEIPSPTATTSAANTTAMTQNQHSNNIQANPLKKSIVTFPIAAPAAPVVVVATAATAPQTEGENKISGIQQVQQKLGFFDMKVSNRKRLMMAPKYNYQNYIRAHSEESDQDRHLIPIKTVMGKVNKIRSPLLVNFARDLHARQAISIPNFDHITPILSNNDTSMPPLIPSFSSQTEQERFSTTTSSEQSVFQASKQIFPDKNQHKLISSATRFKAAISSHQLDSNVSMYSGDSPDRTTSKFTLRSKFYNLSLSLDGSTELDEKSSSQNTPQQPFLPKYQLINSVNNLSRLSSNSNSSSQSPQSKFQSSINFAKSVPKEFSQENNTKLNSKQFATPFMTEQGGSNRKRIVFYPSLGNTGIRSSLIRKIESPKKQVQDQICLLSPTSSIDFSLSNMHIIQQNSVTNTPQIKLTLKK